MFLANLVAAGWHDARTLHTRCAEHGELVDVQAVAAGESVATSWSQDSLKAAPFAAHRMGDDHCTLCAGAIGVATPKHRTAESSATQFVQLVAAAADEPFRPIALLRVAPKSSPPDPA